MGSLTYAEIVGYIGTLAVIISFLLTDFRKFRIANIIACSIFIYYGHLTKTYPTMIVNVIIIILNSYQLLREKFGGVK